MLSFLKIFFRKWTNFFSDIFLKKGKKGKFIFAKYFVTIYDNIFNLFNKIFVTELVLDNGKGKKGK
jgi:hypothetical protein